MTDLVKEYLKHRIEGEGVRGVSDAPPMFRNLHYISSDLGHLPRSVRAEYQDYLEYIERLSEEYNDDTVDSLRLNYDELTNLAQPRLGIENLALRQIPTPYETDHFSYELRVPTSASLTDFRLQDQRETSRGRVVTYQVVFIDSREQTRRPDYTEMFRRRP